MTLIIDHTTYQSPNHSARPGNLQPRAIVLHSTEGRWPSDIEWLCNPQPVYPDQRVSAHYCIDPAGVVYRLVPDDRAAWHAGVSELHGIKNWNDFSIGIELSHLQGHPWTPAALSALTELCKAKILQYAIRQDMIVAHRWIAPNRKVDPTDWPDADLRDWIASLYNTPHGAPPEWGADAVYHSSWAIPTAWRAAGMAWGKALASEFLAPDKRVYQPFERAVVTWTAADGVKVYRP